MRDMGLGSMHDSSRDSPTRSRDQDHNEESARRRMQGVGLKVCLSLSPSSHPLLFKVRTTFKTLKFKVNFKFLCDPTSFPIFSDTWRVNFQYSRGDCVTERYH
jgi:hypothetical protein